MDSIFQDVGLPTPDVTHNPTQPDLIQDVTSKKSNPDVTADGVAPSSTGGKTAAAAGEYGTCAVALYDYQVWPLSQLFSASFLHYN